MVTRLRKLTVIMASFLVTLFLVSFLETKVLAATGLGISPSLITNTVLVPGSKVSGVLTISRSGTNERSVVHLEVHSQTVSSWIQFPEGVDYNIESGDFRISVPYVITVPQEVSNGAYSGSIIASLAPTSSDSAVKLVQGVRSDIKLEVNATRLVEDIKIQYVKPVDTEFGQPYKFIVKVNNEGNISTGIDSISVRFLSLQDKTLRDLRVPIDREVGAFTSEDLEISVPDTDYLPPGNYFARVVINKDGKSIFSDTFAYTITTVKSKPGGQNNPTPTLEEGTIQQLRAASFLAGIMVALGSIVLIIIILLYVLYRNSKKNSTDR